MPKVRFNNYSRRDVDFKSFKATIPERNVAPPLFSDCCQSDPEQQPDENLTSSPSFSSLLEQQTHQYLNKHEVPFENQSSCSHTEEDKEREFETKTITPTLSKRKSLSNLPKPLSRRSCCLSSMVNQQGIQAKGVSPTAKTVSDDSLMATTATIASDESATSASSQNATTNKWCLSSHSDDSLDFPFMDDKADNSDETKEASCQGWGHFVDVIPVESKPSKRSCYRREESPSFCPPRFRYSPYSPQSLSLFHGRLPAVPRVPKHNSLVGLTVRSGHGVSTNKFFRYPGVILRHSTSTESISSGLCNVHI